MLVDISLPFYLLSQSIKILCHNLTNPVINSFSLHTLFPDRIIKTHLCTFSPGGCIKPAKTLDLARWRNCFPVLWAIYIRRSVKGVWVVRGWAVWSGDWVEKDVSLLLDSWKCLEVLWESRSQVNISLSDGMSCFCQNICCKLNFLLFQLLASFSLDLFYCFKVRKKDIYKESDALKWGHSLYFKKWRDSLMLISWILIRLHKNNLA